MIADSVRLALPAEAGQIVDVQIQLRVSYPADVTRRTFEREGGTQRHQQTQLALAIRRAPQGEVKLRADFGAGLEIGHAGTGVDFMAADRGRQGCRDAQFNTVAIE